MANTKLQNIIKNIKRYRKERGLSQEKLAEMCNVSRDFISQVERGINMPSLKTLIIIADKLEVSLGDLESD